MPKLQQFCSFYLDGLLFGVALEGVQEVFVPLEMTHIPLANDMVSGLINLRGQLVTAINLRRKLQLPARSADTAGMNVVVHTDDGPVSMLVDEIGDVIEVDESTFENPPETLQKELSGMILGVHKLDGKLLHILDIIKACDIPIAPG